MCCDLLSQRPSLLPVQASRISWPYAGMAKAFPGPQRIKTENTVSTLCNTNLDYLLYQSILIMTPCQLTMLCEYPSCSGPFYFSPVPTSLGENAIPPGAGSSDVCSSRNSTESCANEAFRFNPNKQRNCKRPLNYHFLPKALYTWHYIFFTQSLEMCHFLMD